METGWPNRQKIFSGSGFMPGSSASPMRAFLCAGVSALIHSGTPPSGIPSGPAATRPGTGGGAGGFAWLAGVVWGVDCVEAVCANVAEQMAAATQSAMTNFLNMLDSPCCEDMTLDLIGESSLRPAEIREAAREQHCRDN